MAIKRTDRFNKIRHGSFIFCPEQHEILLNKDGYYLLIVKNEDIVHKARILKAEDIALSIADLKRQQCWKFLLG